MCPLSLYRMSCSKSKLQFITITDDKDALKTLHFACLHPSCIASSSLSAKYFGVCSQILLPRHFASFLQTAGTEELCRQLPSSLVWHVSEWQTQRQHNGMRRVVPVLTISRSHYSLERKPWPYLWLFSNGETPHSINLPQFQLNFTLFYFFINNKTNFKLRKNSKHSYMNVLKNRYLIVKFSQKIF